MTIEELEAELETVKRELTAVTILEDGREIASVANLLAVIHGDGGHYALAHGWGRAILDAEAVVVALRSERDKLKEAFENTRRQNTDLMFQLFDAQERGRAVNIEPVLHENAQLKARLSELLKEREASNVVTTQLVELVHRLGNTPTIEDDEETP